MSGAIEGYKRIEVQRGLWFEEFEPGVLYQHRPGRTITEADNVLFTTLTMNTQALHLDAAFSDALPPFNQRLVNSMFTLSTLVGLSVAQLTQGTIVGNLGFSDVAFPKPMFHGDTLYAETEVTDKRESKSRPGEGIVTFSHVGRNQHGDVVATASRKTMVRKRPAERGGLMALTETGPGWLFCPADRPERFEKAAAAADVVILDLEDGVAAKDREAARAALIATPLDPSKTVVRVNPVTTPDHAVDVEALKATDYTTVMLAKTETAEQVASLAPLDVIVLVETPLGALAVTETARVDNAFAVMWGAEDLFAVTGGTANRWPDGSYRDVARHVRSQSLLAAKAYGRMALDSVYLDIKDLDGLAAETDDAVAVGFDAKVAIHPSQVAVIRAGYAPTEKQVDWARRVLDTARDQRGVFQFEGIMVDAPVLRRAERIVALAPHPGS